MPDLNNKQIIVLLIVPCLVTKHIWERNVAALPEKQVKPLILLFFSPSPPPSSSFSSQQHKGEKKTAKLCLKWVSLKKKKGGKYWVGRGRIIPRLCGVAHLRTINVIITPLPEGDLFFLPYTRLLEHLRYWQFGLGNSLLCGVCGGSLLNAADVPHFV